MPRNRALDGLRGLAACGVLASHGGLYTYDGVWEPGRAAVRLFFVLSGYLITRVLFQLGEADDAPIRRYGRFLARRSLRLWPSVWMLFVVVWLLGDADFRSHWPWYLTYTSNVRVALHPGSWGWRLGALWSLAVEEQFYVVWPFLVWACQSRQSRIVGCVGLISGRARAAAGVSGDQCEQ